MASSSNLFRGRARCVVAALALLVGAGLTLPTTATAQSINYPYNPDSDTDQNIGTPDLLSLLTVFGSEFLPDPIAIDSLTLEEYLQLLQESIAAANDALDAIPAPECDPCDGLSEVTFGTTTYPVVPIGCECWFAKNLDTYVFANGDVIPALDDVDPETDDTWQAWANNNPIDGSRFGRMYSLGARSDARKICPSGWKVPEYSDALAVQNQIGWHYSGTGITTLMYPEDPITGIDYLHAQDCTNDFGFNGHPVGALDPAGGGYNEFNSTVYWGTQTGTWGGGISIAGSNGVEGAGYAVRCVKYQPNDRGCTDANYLEFEPNAQEEDGSCLTLVVRGCTDSEANNFNPEANTDVGTCVYGTAPPPCNYESALEFHGVDYSLVEVAGECWFGENLRSSAFANGDSIATYVEGTTDVDAPWQIGNLPPVDLGNDEAFGFLYNRAAALDERNVCPSGWHVSSAEDWDELAQQFGGFMTLMTSIASLGVSSDGSGYWDSATKQNNASGLTIHPAGYFMTTGSEVLSQGHYVSFFQANGELQWGYLDNSMALVRYELAGSWIENINTFGASIRCVKD